MTLAVLIPAAGESSRLGRNKLLVSIDEQPMLQNRINLCTRVMAKIGGKTYCVLGYDAQTVYHQINTPLCQFLFFPEWPLGLTNSIAYGISQLPDEISAVLILLADQWAITDNDLTQLITLWQQNPNKIIASNYHEVIGVPTIFPKNYFKYFFKEDNNSGHTGAKKLLVNFQSQVISLEMQHAQYDLDTPHQLECLPQTQQLLQRQDNGK